VAGYSGTPLAKKLGIKEGQALAFLSAPTGFDRMVAPLPAGVTVRSRLGGNLDVVVLFTRRRAELERRLDALKRAIHPAGGLWVAWPKRSSGIETDMTEDVVRAVALPQGLVDNKVCAIDETWSGLRVVYRLANRN
jgi:hypothetical protein